MKQDKEYQVLKDIPINGGKAIEKGSMVTRTHGVYYLNGGMLPRDYQEDFDTLIETEEVTGWDYIVPVTKKRAFKNTKEQV